MSKGKVIKHWFKHDFYSSRNIKLQKLEYCHPMVGYAIYFKLIELLYQNNGWMEYDLRFLAYTLNYEKEPISDVVEGFDLFIFDGTMFTAKRVVSSIEEITRKSEAARKSANARWKNKKKD